MAAMVAKYFNSCALVSALNVPESWKRVVSGDFEFMKKVKFVSKETALKRAKKENRKVLWKDEKYGWHAATDRRNTPDFATEVIDL